MEQKIKDILTSFGATLTLYKVVNKLCIIAFNTEKTDKPNRDLYNALSTVEGITSMLRRDFRQGKKEELVSNYYLHFATTELGVLDTTKVTGQCIKFVDDFNIKTHRDMMNAVIPFMKHFNDSIHTLKNYQDKRNYRIIKKVMIKYFYKHGLVDHVSLQKSYCDDILAEFTFGGWGCHLRATQSDFVDGMHEMLCHYTSPVRKVDMAFSNTSETYPVAINKEIYQKREIDPKTINYDFEQYLTIFRHLNDGNIHKLLNLSN